MAATDNGARVRRIFDEVINTGNFDGASELIGDNYVNHGFDGIPPGLQGFKEVIGLFRTAFPDMKVHVEDVISEGETVSTRGRMTGTHRGDFMGVPPTGKSVDIEYIDIWRAEGGKFVENWVQMDRLGMFQQLGLAPAPASAPAAASTQTV